MDINGQIAIVTGGGSGMGAATAEHLAEKGAKVAVVDINANAAKEVAQRIDGKAFLCDVTDNKSAESALHEIEEAIGKPSICINCAGIAPAKRMVGREGAMPLEDFNQVIQVNLIGSFNIMRLAAQVMSTIEEPLNADGERGVIINTASIAAYEGQIGQTAYSASKAGIIGLTLPAARELARFGVRVMAIAPGLVETPMMTGFPQEVQDSLAQQVPFPKRLAKSKEFAQLAQQIIENPMLNGSVIRLDGAMRMEAK